MSNKEQSKQDVMLDKYFEEKRSYFRERGRPDIAKGLTVEDYKRWLKEYGHNEYALGDVTLDWKDSPIKVAINDYGNDIAEYTLKYIKNEVTESERDLLYVGSGEQLARKVEQLLSEQRQKLIDEISSAQKEPHPVEGLVWVAMSRKLLDNLLADKPNE